MKRKNLLRFFAGIGIIILLNVVATQFFFRIDLTEDQRYSISPATKQVLEGLDDQVFVTVYLEGDMPAGFERLQTAIRERLEEFEIYGGTHIRYRFVDPMASADKKQRNQALVELAKKGLQPTNLIDKEGGKQVEKIIFPGALVTYKGKEVPVLLLRGNQATKGMSNQQILNQSVEGVEYELASAIRRLTIKSKKRIGLIEPYNSLAPVQITDLVTSLQENYDVYRVNLPVQPSLQGLDAIIIAKPDTAFREEDKYKIDQFIVNGGNALFFIDALRIDSVGAQGTFAFPYNLNLTDLLFRYGVRVNENLVQDLNSGVIPLNVGTMGDRPQIQLMPWPFFPLINTFSKHPIVRNLDAVYLRFASTLDTIKVPGVVKTPLLLTSPYTKIIPAPAGVSYNDARKDPDPKQYHSGNLPVAYLLEGKFRSLYANRITSADPRSATFKESNKPAKIVVFSDGDLPVNNVNRKTGQIMPLGFDPYTNVTFANKDFILHSIEYMLDPNGVIAARTKEIALRPLDKLKVADQRLQWQVVNLIVPVVLIILYGIIRAWLRKKKYGRVLA
jgi:gliding-associated putative ABC transporter substrate-binding component GldG